MLHFCRAMGTGVRLSKLQNLYVRARSISQSTQENPAYAVGIPIRGWAVRFGACGTGMVPHSQPIIALFYSLSQQLQLVARWWQSAARPAIEPKPPQLGSGSGRPVRAGSPRSDYNAPSFWLNPNLTPKRRNYRLGAAAGSVMLSATVPARDGCASMGRLPAFRVQPPCKIQPLGPSSGKRRAA